MDFDLWTLFVEYLFGSFWLSVIGIAVLLFCILVIFGKVSKLTWLNFIMMFIMCMTIGYRYRWLNVLLGLAITIWAYISFKNYTLG